MTSRQAYLSVLKYEFQNRLIDFPPPIGHRLELAVARTYWQRAKEAADKYMSRHVLTWLEARL